MVQCLRYSFPKVPYPAKSSSTFLSTAASLKSSKLRNFFTAPRAPFFSVCVHRVVPNYLSVAPKFCYFHFFSALSSGPSSLLPSPHPTLFVHRPALSPPPISILLRYGSKLESALRHKLCPSWFLYWRSDLGHKVRVLVLQPSAFLLFRKGCHSRGAKALPVSVWGQGQKTSERGPCEDGDKTSRG